MGSLSPFVRSMVGGHCVQLEAPVLVRLNLDALSMEAVLCAPLVVYALENISTDV